MNDDAVLAALRIFALFVFPGAAAAGVYWASPRRRRDKFTAAALAALAVLVAAIAIFVP